MQRTDLKGEIPELRSLRFPFGLLIVIYHFTNYFSDYETTSWVILEDLAFVLDFFFILSGFVMAHVYGRRENFDFGRYLNRRFFRIYPLHFLTLLSLVFLAVIGSAFGVEASNPERYQLDTVWMHLTMVHAWFFDPVITFNVPSWSVSAEWFVYLIFPAFLMLGRHVSPARLLILAAVLAAIWYFVTLFVTGYSFPHLEGYALFRVCVDFFLGFALREFLRKNSLPFTRSRHASRVYAALMAVLGIFGFPPILPMIVFVWFAASAYERVLAERADGFFDNHTFNRFGDTAFALYITHMPVAIYATNLIEMKTGLSLPGPSSDPIVATVFVGLIVLAVIVAWLVHNLIEQPMAVYGPRFVESLFKPRTKRRFRSGKG